MSKEFFQANHSLNKLQALYFIGIMLGSTLISGCAQEVLPGSVENQSGIVIKSQSTVESVSEVKAVKPLHAPNLDAATLYQILAAEMMATKGYSKQAFDALYVLGFRMQNPDLAKRVFELSMRTYDINRIEQAAKLWRKVSPNEPIAWRASFLISLRHDEVALGVKQWDRFRALSTASLESDLLLTGRRIAASVATDSGTQFLKALTLKYPNVWASHYILAEVYVVQKQDAHALASLQKALDVKTDKSTRMIYQLLAKVYLNLMRPLEGLKALAGYAEQNPQDWLVQERMARLEVQAEQYQEAIVRYERILKAEPEAYTSRLSLALIKLELKAFDEAEVHLKTVLNVVGYQQVARYYLGLLYQAQKEYDKALSYLKEVTSETYRVDARLHQAEIYQALDDMPKAFSILKGVKTDQPSEQLKIYRALGIFYSYEGQEALAIKAYNSALALDADNIEILLAQALVYYQMEDLTGYTQNLERVIHIYPDDVDALNALGYYYVENGHHLKEAKTLLTHALALAPNNYYVLDSMGWFYFTVGEYDQAVKYLKKALDVKVDDEVLIHLVSTYWKQGNIELAERLWLNNHKKFLKNIRLQGLLNDLKSSK